MQIIQSVLALALTLGILVTLHEFGHFWVARRCGVKVLRFSVGFGKPLFSWYDRHGTEFAVAAIPLGGYVKMLDAREGPVPAELEDQAFTSKPPSQRIAIAAAGPVANFIFAIFAYWLISVVGVTTVAPIVGEVAPDSVAERAGLQEGPPAARRRRTVSATAPDLGNREVACAVTTSTHPSTSASVVSRRSSAANWLSDLGRMSAPLAIAFCRSCALLGSKSLASSSSRAVSIPMPLADLVIDDMNCRRSHLACRKSRAWASSRTAIYNCTWSLAMSRPVPNAVRFCGRMAAWISDAESASSSGIPMSPPETTSAESWPTTWPSCMANRVPPTFRTRLLAPEIMFEISSGACCSRTSVMASAMLDATGSANWIHTGMVASIHSVRLNSFGVAVSSEMEVASLSHSAATLKACSSWSRS